MHRKVLVAAPLAVLVLAGLLGTKAGSADPVGAPWVSMEIPANPLDPETRGAAFLVRAYYHERPTGFEPSGTAEGLVDGRRVSVPLEFTKTSRPGVFAVRQQWPAQGRWVLAIGVSGPGGSPTLIADLGANGGVAKADQFYGNANSELSLQSVRVVRTLDAGAIDAALRQVAAK